MRPARVDRSCCLVFKDCLIVSALRQQHLAFCDVRECGAGRRRNGLFSQPFRTNAVGRSRISHIVEHAACEVVSQPALRLGKLWIELQRPLVHTDCLRVILTFPRFQCGRPSPKNILERIGIFGLPRRVGADQRLIERDRGPLSDLVLHTKQTVRIAVEPLRPKMRIGLGIDQPGIDPNMIGRRVNTPLQYIANP
jgi:hypothetical protein